MYDYKKDFTNIFHELSHSKNSNQVWNDLIDCMAIAISNAVDLKHYEARETQYMDAAKRLDFSPKMCEAMACIVEAFEENPEQDFLGVLYGDLGLLTSRKGQFFTPMNVCQMMAGMQLTEEDVKRKITENGYITINDPACGAGATLIAAANRLRNMGVNFQTSALFTGNDIDPVVAKMCYIQLSFLGCPGYIAVANTLSDPVTGNILMPDDKDTQDFWFMPMYFNEIWAMRRKCKLIDNVLRLERSVG